MSSMTTAEHWETVYRANGESEVSWHQDEPTVSMSLIAGVAGGGGDIVDIGGGSSALAGRLAAKGFDVTVLDISSAAIERAKKRCGDDSDRINWLVGDVTETKSIGRFDVWHDRAVFHFLTEQRDRSAYSSLLEESLRPGGHLVMGTFAMDGPSRCSGLPVQRYDPRTINRALGGKFSLIESRLETHLTPWGKPQAFQYVVMRRE